MSKNKLNWVAHPKIHLDRCIEIAGDARAGVLLHKIMLWHRSTTVEFDGHRWATSTRSFGTVTRWRTPTASSARSAPRSMCCASRFSPKPAKL